MATKKEIIDTAIAAFKTECGNDRAKLFTWYAEAANRFARRAQKMQEFEQADSKTFLAAKQGQFATHQAEQDALRTAEGIGEE